jgi:hypothetical protein
MLAWQLDGVQDYWTDSLLVYQPDVLLACWSSILLVFQPAGLPASGLPDSSPAKLLSSQASDLIS